MKNTVLPLLAGILLAGCGGSSQRSGVAPTITMQPAPVSAPVGSTATYLVSATGDATLTYQWKLNGSPIAGATTSTYTTPVLAAQDALDAFSVTVSNASGSATSNSVGLTLGPRSPKQGDFRFKLVGLVTNTGTLGRGNIDSNTSYNSGSQLGTSLSVGSAGICAASPLGTCSWLYDLYTSPTNITQTGAVYVSGQFTNLFADLLRNANSANILTAFDEQPANGVYAASYLVIGAGSNQPGGFILNLAQQVPLSALQTAASAAAQQSQVITAVSYNSSTGLADFAAYGWAMDSTTKYEAKVVVSSISSVEADAASLSQMGYIITATGSGPTNGFVLVGTRVVGDTLPRPFSSVSYPNAVLSGPPPVALVYDNNGNAYLSQR